MHKLGALSVLSSTMLVGIVALLIWAVGAAPAGSDRARILGRPRR